jgi:hypothetical protein
MKIGYVNLFLEVAPDGSATPVFPGGIELPDADPAAPAPGESIRVIGPDGTVHALIFGGLDSSPPAPFLQLVAGDDFTVDPSIVLDQIAGNGEISVSSGSFGQTLINGNGQSGFLQLLTLQNLKAQVFRSTVATLAGTFTTSVNLPTAWANNHLFVIGSAFDFQTSGAGATPQFSPNGLGAVNFRVWGNPVNQNITVTILSFGN